MAPVLLRLILLFGLIAISASHGILTDPRQRGALKTKTKTSKVETIDENAPQDYCAHFPAGDKSIVPGSAAASQRRAGKNVYYPFQPFDKSFNWRAGVCGDLKGERPQPHLKGGEYYYDGKIVREYTAGDVVDFSASIVANHNGFFEFYMCNLDSCPDDDISPSCFQKGHCRQLLRAPNPKCDNKESRDCGPIDRNYPGRWYMPCSKNPDDEEHVDVYGGNQESMKYQIPDDLQCDHCVLLWYWSCSNTCQAVGVEEYFTGPDGPNWGNCKGQAGAIGGYVREQPDCGGSEFPEEYYQCADVVVHGAGHRYSTSAPTTSTTTTSLDPPATTYAVEEDYPGNRACRCLGGSPICWDSLANATDGVCVSDRTYDKQSVACKEMCCDYCQDLERRGGSIGECKMRIVKDLCNL